MSLPLAADSKGDIRKTSRQASTWHDKCKCVHLSHTFEEPVGVTLFSAVGLQEGEDVLGDVFHHPGGESGVFQVRDVLRFYHLIFLQVKETSF